MSSPADTLVIHVDDQPRSLFMSFGLLHELLRVIGDLPQVSVIAIDPDLREKVLVLVLSERDAEGTVVKAFPFYTARLSRTDIQAILQWVGEHALDFFLTAMERTVSVHEPHKARLHRVET